MGCTLKYLQSLTTARCLNLTMLGQGVQIPLNLKIFGRFYRVSSMWWNTPGRS
jgi:hypothetical protein